MLLGCDARHVAVVTEAGVSTYTIRQGIQPGGARAGAALRGPTRTDPRADPAFLEVCAVNRPTRGVSLNR